MADGRATWIQGYADALWWNCLVHPAQHGWMEPKGLPKRQVLECPTGDPDPHALACDGLSVRRRRRHPDRLLRRSVAGRPVSAFTTALLACAA